MQKREKILALLFGTIAVLYGGSWLFETVLQGPLEDREKRLAQLEEKIRDRELQRDKVFAAVKQLDHWQSRSLPADPEVARSLYQAWLLELVKRVDLADAKVDSGKPLSRDKDLRSLTFSLRGRGTLAQLTRLLFDFYSADHLHRIQSIGITPIANQRQLNLAITIEALSLTGAKQKDQLSTRKSSRLASARLREYESIVRRNLFGFGGEDVSVEAHTYLTAVVDVNGQSEVWFNVRPMDKTIKLRKGESLGVGLFHGTVEQIDGSDVILASQDQRWLITIGESLAQASALPPEH